MTAKAFTRPASICPVVLVVWSHQVDLAADESIHGRCRAVPLNGMVVIASVALTAAYHIRPHRCEAEPSPACAIFILLALARK